MSFDKDEYRNRRNAGLRGQGEKFDPRGRDVTETTEYKYDMPTASIVRNIPKTPTKKAILKNSKRARKAVAHV